MKEYVAVLVEQQVFDESANEALKAAPQN
jgi:hypothetical protein